jgi:hypothetical protein
MTVLGDVFKELFGMFVADARLTLAILLLVGVVAGLVSAFPAVPYLTGGVLLFGFVAILVEAVVREARRARS